MAPDFRIQRAKAIILREPGVGTDRIERLSPARNASIALQTEMPASIRSLEKVKAAFATMAKDV